MIRRLRFLVVIALLLVAGFQPALAAGAAGEGVVDGLSFDQATHRLFVHGWAAPAQPNVYTSTVRIFIGGTLVYRGRFMRSERPDVVTATGRRDWLSSGWNVEAAVPDDIPAGRQPVAIRFYVSDGGEFQVALPPAAQSIEIPEVRGPSVAAVVVVIIAIILPLVSFVFGEKLVLAVPRTISVRRFFGLSVLASFLLLVAVGVTGSSVRLALDGSPIADSDAVGWFGENRVVRSDEWRILTQMAIGQFNYQPQFPVMNRNVGNDGSNMLVVGMTGAPVMHLSAVAKPATWGFFFLDLRRAMAWHWWFPFFGCFLALWLLLMRMFSLDWRMAAALALTIPLAPYSVVFSGHPAYAAFFPALGMLAADQVLRERRIAIASLCGLVAGLSIAGFVLVLYVPWQIGLIYLSVPFAIATFVARRRELQFGRVQLVAGAVALLVSSVVLFAWWWSTREALATIAASVYPGQRATSVGGDIDPWFLIKGLLSPITMYADSPMMDQSDAGSFMFLLIPLAFGVVTRWIAARRVDAVSVVLMAFVAWTLTYMYFGFGKTFAEYTIWGRATSFRMDLPLGFAQVLLMAWLIGGQQQSGTSRSDWMSGIAAVAAMATMLYAAAMFCLLPVRISVLLPSSFVVLSCVTLGVVSYLLLTHRFTSAVGIYCVWIAGTSLPFNPVGQAPTSVRAATGWSRHIPVPPAAMEERRIAVLDEHGWTVTMVAVNIPIANTVLYYPQQSLWAKLDPAGGQRTLYNRYQHLLFVTAQLPAGTSFQIDSQRLDAVRVTVDPEQFDFRLLGVSYVLTSKGTAVKLALNQTLQRVDGDDVWALYSVVK